MAPNRGQNRQREFLKLAQADVRDRDPEEERAPSSSEDESSSEDGAKNFDGREHYVNVEKSKIRKPKAIALGPQYRGSKIGRGDLEGEDEDDPFSRGLMDDDSNLSEDEMSSRNFESQEGESGDSDAASNDGPEDGTDATDLSDGEEHATRDKLVLDAARHQELRQIIKDDASTMAKTLSQANREEVQKGQAVKRQRAAFDSLLNTRIKLQKSLIATNTLIGTAAEQLHTEREHAQQALEAAETAAFALWSSLDNFRERLASVRTGKKRKRTSFSMGSQTADLWAHVQAQESESQPDRDAILEKWSHRTQGPSLGADRLHQTKQDGITSVLHEQLLDPTRLIARAHAPRSCAPLQLSQRLTEDNKIYDDADFYGLLLKELLEQKSQDSVASSNIDLGFQMRRDAKTRRNVDTKASKGRKLRYTVHEKLQNFMAPEDRTKWGARQADELFGSLFGQRLELLDRDEEDDEIDATVAKEAGLLMFGS